MRVITTFCNESDKKDTALHHGFYSIELIRQITKRHNSINEKIKGMVENH
jgi:hypothetical protein